MADFEPVLDEEELQLGASKAVDAFGRSVLLCRTAEGVFAIANECTHQKMPLEGGRIRGCNIFCPEHGVRFDLRTGCPTGTLTDIPVRRYSVRTSGGRIEIADAEPDAPT